MKPPVCPLHRDPLDEPMRHTGTRDGRDYYKCPNCSAEINRPAQPATEKPTKP